MIERNGVKRTLAGYTTTTHYNTAWKNDCIFNIRILMYINSTKQITILKGGIRNACRQLHFIIVTYKSMLCTEINSIKENTIVYVTQINDAPFLLSWLNNKYIIPVKIIA